MSTQTVNAMSTMNENETTGAEEVVEEETGTEDAGASEETSEETSKEENLTTDYKTKFEELQKKIADDAFKYRKQKREGVETKVVEADESDDDDNKPLTKAELAKLLDERESKISKQFSNKEALQLATGLTDNEDEAKYAVALWEHVTLPFDSMEEQLRFIVAGMNAERTLKQKDELMRTLKSKETARKNTATTTRDPLSAGQPKIDPQVLAALKNTGFTYNSGKKAYENVLKNGTKMYNDGKGKKWFE